MLKRYLGLALNLKKLRDRSLDVLEGSVTLNLAACELGNIIWREHALKDLVSRQEAINKAEQTTKILEVTVITPYL